MLILQFLRVKSLLYYMLFLVGSIFVCNLDLN